MQGQRAERVGGDAGLQHHDLLLHQRGEQRAAALADQVHHGTHGGDARGEGRGHTCSSKNTRKGISSDVRRLLTAFRPSLEALNR
jgi:hypothetical protein